MGADSSILTTIKKMLGLAEDYAAFDTDVGVLINSALFSLMQIGVGAETGFAIRTGEETWEDFLGTDVTNLEGVKSYIYLKVRLLFDPPSSSAAEKAMNEEIEELEWRLNIENGGIS